MRVNVSMDENLWESIGRCADNLHISRSAFISMACAQKIQADKVLDSFPQFVDSMQFLKSQKTP